MILNLQEFNSERKKKQGARNLAILFAISYFNNFIIGNIIANLVGLFDKVSLISSIFYLFNPLQYVYWKMETLPLRSRNQFVQELSENSKIFSN